MTRQVGRSSSLFSFSSSWVSGNAAYPARSVCAFQLQRDMSKGSEMHVCSAAGASNAEVGRAAR